MGDDGDKEVRALCKLFIGGIPRSITDEQLAEAFIQFTDDETLNDCVVIKDEAKSSRGFGFVTYNKLSDTDNCLANRPHVLAGKEVEVKHAIPRDEQNPTNHSRTNKIFVGGLPAETDENDVKEAIETYVLDAGESLNVTVDKVDIIAKSTRGFCFVEMASEDDADKVVIVKYFKVKGKKVEAKKAEPKGQKGMSGGRGGRGGGRDSNRGMGQFGGGRWGGGGGDSMWGGSQGYGNMYDQFAGRSGGYGDYGFNSYGANYGSAMGGGQYDFMGGYGQSASSFGPSRTSNGRYGGGSGSGRGRGRGGGGSGYGGGGSGYRPY